MFPTFWSCKHIFRDFVSSAVGIWYLLPKMLGHIISQNIPQIMSWDYENCPKINIKVLFLKSKIAIEMTMICSNLNDSSI
jgi:hypothetical protein